MLGRSRPRHRCEPPTMNHFARSVLATVRAYCRYTPFPRGHQRLLRFACRLLALSAVEVPGPMGTKLLLDWRRDWGWEAMYVKGVFEAETSATLTAILRDSDIVFDIGANIGWYTVLMATLVPNGHCYAFEPEPE